MSVLLAFLKKMKLIYLEIRCLCVMKLFLKTSKDSSTATLLTGELSIGWEWIFSVI